MTERVVIHPKLDRAHDAAFMYAFQQARNHTSVDVQPSRKLTEGQIEIVAGTADRLGKKYVKELLAMTDQQEKVFATTFANLHAPLPTVELHEDHSHVHGGHGDHCDHDHSLLKRVKNEKLKRIAGIVICQFDCTIPIGIQVVSSFLGGSHAGDHHHEDPLAMLPKKAGIVYELTSEEQKTLNDKEIRNGRMLVSLPLDRVVTASEIEDSTMDPKTKALLLEDIKEVSPEPVKKKISKPKSRLKKTVATVAVATVLGGGGLLGAHSLQSQEIQSKPQQITKTEPNLVVPHEQPSRELKVTRALKVKKGDTQWGIVEQALEAAGYTATIERTNVIVDLTAAENIATIPNPDKLEIGERLQIPNEVVIDQIVEVMEDPEKDPTLVQDLYALNDLPAMSKEKVVAKEKTRIRHIWSALKKRK